MQRDGNNLEASLHDTDAAIMAEMERERAAAVEACTAEVRDHLHGYLVRNPGASFTEWIAALHPENVDVDNRLRNEGNPWLVLWYEAGASAKVKEIRWLHAGLTLLSAIWMGLLIFMRNSCSVSLQGSRGMSFIAMTAGILLFLLQAVMLLTAFFRVHNKDWVRFVYKVAVVQLLSQTCVAFMGLTAFIFNSHGIKVLQCIWATHCITFYRGKSFEKDVVQWRESGRLVDGPFSLVDIEVHRETNGTILPMKHIRNNGSVWDGISIQAAVPLEVTFTAADRELLGVMLVIYALAVLTTAVYICIYRVMGQSQGRWIPEFLSFKRMESAACFLCLLLTLLSIFSGAHRGQGMFLAPTFIGSATFFALLSQLMLTVGRRRPLTGPFNQWQKRTTTAQGIGVMVAFTYTAGLCSSLNVCSVAHVWPSTMQSRRESLFMGATFCHLLLSSGYAFSLWAHLYLARRQSTGEAISPAVANELRVPAAPQQEQQTSSTGSQPPQPAEATECIVCMDEFRNTVLVPCGHLALCNTCARSIAGSRRPLCPVCNGAVDDFCVVYNA